MNCINLNKQFGDKYRVTAEKGTRHNVDPWYYRIESSKVQCAHVYPWDGNKLALYRGKHGGIVSQLLALPTTELYTDGSDGVTILFKVADLDAVAYLVKLKRRKRLSKEGRLALQERGLKLGKRHSTE